MDEYLNEDQRQLVDTLGRYLEREHPLPESGIVPTGSQHPTGPSAHWAAFANFGLLALSVDEEHGGILDDSIGVHAVMEKFGRHLVNEPYLSTIVQGAPLLASAASRQPEVDVLLQRVLDGSAQLAMAQSEPQTDYNLCNVATRAERAADGWVINGLKVFVANAAQAEAVLVVARTRGTLMDEGGLSLFIVDPKAQGIRSRKYFNLDGSSSSEIWFDNVSVSATSLVGVEHQSFPELKQACARANAALCAEAVGVMSAVLEATVEYSKERIQFGASIGSFQVIQHRLVDMYMRLEKSRSLSLRASALARTDNFLAAVSAAKAMCSETAQFISQSAIQLHGGIGMTDELALGKFIKRLLVIRHTLGDEHHHIKQFVQLTQPQVASALQPH